jgi:hypothetical protein
MPESLPIPPTGTETQELDGQGVATSSVSNQVAETQEPATDSVAETQEPATHSVAETQEPTTHSVAKTKEPTTHSIAETQEPATHSVAKTQEPTTHSLAETQEPAIVATQEPTTAETQELATDIDTEIQESEVQGAATLLSLHQQAETQEAVVDPVAAPQEQANVAVTATQESVTPQPE